MSSGPLFVLAIMSWSVLQGAEIDAVMLKRKADGIASISAQIKDEGTRRICLEAVERDHACRMAILRLSEQGSGTLAPFSVELITRIDDLWLASRLQGRSGADEGATYHCVIAERSDRSGDEVDRGLTQKAGIQLGERIRERKYRACSMSLSVSDQQQVVVKSCMLDATFSSADFVRQEAMAFVEASLPGLLKDPDSGALALMPQLALKREPTRPMGKAVLAATGHVEVAVLVGSDSDRLTVYELELDPWARPRPALISARVNDVETKRIAFEYTIYADLFRVAPAQLPRAGSIQSTGDIGASLGHVHKQQDGRYQATLDVRVDDGSARPNRQMLGECVVNADGTIVWGGIRIRK